MSSSNDVLADRVDAWLLPLSTGDAGGPDLEHDADFREFEKALAGKAATQFDEGLPPDHRAAQARAESLFDRTRDLRVAIGWTRAALHLEGIVALPLGLRLMQELLETFPAELNPKADPDDGSFYARGNALASLAQPAGLLGDLRQAVLLTDRLLGPVRVRSVEIAFGTLSPRDDEAVLSREQLRAFFAAAPAAAAVRASVEEAAARLRALGPFLREQLGALEAPDLAPLMTMLAAVLSVMPTPEGAASEAPAEGKSSAGNGAAAASPAMSGSVRSRADAICAIEMVCEYLERTEPTNPAPLFLRRAKRLIDRNFLQLMKDLAPDALAEVAKIMGVDPESVTTPADSA